MKKTNDNNVLLINDLPGYGKVALAAMMPVLTHMQCEVFSLPTALVSNTLDYGKFDILETTDYMRNSMQIWEELGFRFDAISTGFIVSQEQTELVTEFCRKQAAQGTEIFVDPIMGDEGKLYNGITMERVDCMRRMCEVADVVVPNITEAAFLVGDDGVGESYTEAEVHGIAKKLQVLGSKNVVITSVPMGEQRGTAILDREGNFEIIPFDEIPVRFPGTGDIFSAVLLGNYVRRTGLREAVVRAMGTVADLIHVSRDTEDKYKGIPLEQFLDKVQY